MFEVDENIFDLHRGDSVPVNMQHLANEVVKLSGRLQKMREFANLNYSAAYKIFKKHDKKAPAEAVKLLPQLPTRPRLGTGSPAPLPEFRSAVPRPLPLALAAQKYSLRLEGSMTFMWQAPVAPNELTCVLGILLSSLQLSELECPTALDATG